MKKNTKLKFLSESILLEESGLPLINTIVIVSITLFLVLFLVWANYMEIEDTISVTGFSAVSGTSIEDKSFIGFVQTKDVTSIDIGQKSYIDIAGITGRQSLSGSVKRIGDEPIKDTQNRTYYEIEIQLLTETIDGFDLEEVLLDEMESDIQIVTGTRSLLQYFLGNLYDVGKNALGSN